MVFNSSQGGCMVSSFRANNSRGERGVVAICGEFPRVRSTFKQETCADRREGLSCKDLRLMSALLSCCCFALLHHFHCMSCRPQHIVA